MRHSGFSLIELSIVLVILGLLVGGILGGQSLIHAAELRSVITDRDKYITALNSFREKYDALPGDMPNATAYWGVAAGGCPNGAGSGKQTCNGNGNNRISDTQESFRVWQHLANANLIEGSFSGVGGAGGIVEAVIGENIPESKLSGQGFGIVNSDFFYSGLPVDSILMGTEQRKTHFFLLGSKTDTVNDGKTISPADSYSIDNKLDDGKPMSGSVNSIQSVIASRGGHIEQYCYDLDTETYYLNKDEGSYDQGSGCSMLLNAGID